MQQETSRSNRERSAAMRKQLLAAARALFIVGGYAQTSTPEIVSAAGVTRGALYHHFEDKKALFAAVCESEAAMVAAEIDAATPEGMPARDALLIGGNAFLEAMHQPGRTRLLLLDGPAVLGRAAMDAIDGRHGTRSLKAGIAFAMREGVMPRTLPLDAVTSLLAAAFDRAALAIDAGASIDEYRRALAVLIDGLIRSR